MRHAPLACALLLGSPAAASAWYAPLDSLRTDGLASQLVVTTPYLGAGQGNCSIYPYNYYGACEHPAWDIGAAPGGYWINGQPVKSVEAGRVAAINPDGYCGQDVFVDHGNGVFSRYCHLAGYGDIWVGKNIAAREVIGFLGSTGAEAPHLHLEARSGGIYGAYINLGNPLDWPEGAGGPPPGPSECEQLGFAGTCDGSVLRWCENGSVRAYDCASVGRACGWENDQTGNNCITAPPPEPPPPPPPSECEQLGFAGTCDGNVLRWCENDSVRTYDCAAIGRVCGWENDQTGNNCIAAPPPPPPPPPPPDECEQLGYAGTCDGNVLRWCENGSVQTYNCASAGLVCGWQDANVGHNCLQSGTTTTFNERPAAETPPPAEEQPAPATPAPDQDEPRDQPADSSAEVLAGSCAQSGTDVLLVPLALAWLVSRRARRPRNG